MGRANPAPRPHTRCPSEQSVRVPFRPDDFLMGFVLGILVSILAITVRACLASS